MNSDVVSPAPHTQTFLAALALGPGRRVLVDGRAVYRRRLARCDGRMEPVESRAGEVLALRCGLCGFVARGSAGLLPEVRR